MAAMNNDVKGSKTDVLIGAGILFLIIVALTDPQGVPYVIGAFLVLGFFRAAFWINDKLLGGK